jgi:hypothetical protein
MADKTRDERFRQHEAILQGVARMVAAHHEMNCQQGASKLFEPPLHPVPLNGDGVPLHPATLAQWQRRLGQAHQPRNGLEPLAADGDTWEDTADKETDED